MIEPLTHQRRVETFRAAIGQIREVAVDLVQAELFGASDEVVRCLNMLQKQYEIFSEEELGDLLSLAESGQGRAATDVNPQEVRGGAHRPVSALTLARTGRLNSEGQRRRRPGIDIIPGSVRRAREEAGLSLAEVAGDKVTRVLIWYVESGRCRPSLESLQLIAERTGKPLSFFVGGQE